MKPPTLLALILLGLISACSSDVSSIPGCIRFTEIDSLDYRVEPGILGPDGFVPSGSNDYTYSQGLHSRTELSPVLGKILIPLSLWISMNDPRNVHRSKNSWNINGVPYVAIEPN